MAGVKWMAKSNNIMINLANKCKEASKTVAQKSTSEKNTALFAMAEQLAKDQNTIISENAKDIEKAKAEKLSSAMIDRLHLDSARIIKMADALVEIAKLNDPVGEITQVWRRPNGLQVAYKRIPLGVIGMIYESRPNVTSDAAGLCLKSGNAVFLRGGSEAFYSNKAIVSALHTGLENAKIVRDAITFVPTTDRTAINEMLKLSDYIDIIIPRGGEGLIRFVSENSRIPVIKHYKGVCHQYVDATADIPMAVNLLIDGKTSRPGVCNALETLLVHHDIAAEFLPKVFQTCQTKKVEIRGCSTARKYLPSIKEANEEDFYQEYLDLVLSVKVVNNMDEAILHISKYGSDHTEVIVTNSYSNAQEFLRRVNSSVVLVNASSRFSDGGELGLGAEIGISTTKLHAYGPMGLESLTTKKFIVQGSGQVRHPDLL